MKTYRFEIEVEVEISTTGAQFDNEYVREDLLNRIHYQGPSDLKITDVKIKPCACKQANQLPLFNDPKFGL